MTRLSLALALLLAALAGCGGGDEGAAGDGRPATVPAGRELRLTGREYSFSPGRVVVTGAPPSVKVTLENQGDLPHNARFLRDGRDVGGTPTFQSGPPRSAEVRLPRGKYRMVCTVGNHEELGMVGSLEVR